MIEFEKPDVVVLTGDMVSGYAWKNEDNWHKEIWERWVQPFRNKNQKYIYVLGNHDASADLNTKEVIELDRTEPLSIRSEDDRDTYFVPVYKNENEVFYIWAFNT